MNPAFSIIIVTWNAVHHLKRFLPSVAETKYSNFEIIIADNASEDETTAWIRAEYPDIKVVTFDQNYGYCGGNNRAVKYAEGDILIFLNNDAETDPKWLMPIAAAFSDPLAGIVQPKIRSVEKRDYFEYAGAAGGLIDWLGYPFCRGRIFDTVEKDEGQYNEPSEIFWASGAAFAIRKELFLESGGFDEDFEFHMEEIDLCWRCLKTGKKILYEPKSCVYHLGGGSMPMGSPRKVFYNYRNSLVMLTKNLDDFLLPKIFLRLVLDGISGIRSFLTGKPGETLAIIRAHFSFYTMLPASLKKRKQLKLSSTHPTPPRLIFDKLIPVQALLLNRKTFSDLMR